MKHTSFASNLSLIGMAFLAAVLLAPAQEQPLVPYPAGFRSWHLVKTKVVGRESKSFPTRGGIHLFYANDQAVEGYRTGSFPDGSAIVDEIVALEEGEGDRKGNFTEGERRSLDFMIKNAERYKDAAGWGFEVFEGDSRTGKLDANARAQCSACHSQQNETDSVFSKVRP
jgi:Cytochrome P460